MSCMAKPLRLLAGVASASVLFSSQVAALPYGSLDPYGFSLGGTGVAHGTNANAIFYNPALLSITGETQEISLMAGARFSDKEKVLDALATYQDNGMEAAYDTALDDYKAGASNGRQDVVDTTTALGNQLVLMANKPIQREYLYAAVFAIPNKKIDMSLLIDSREVGGAQIFPTSNDINELLRVRNEAGEGSLSPDESFDSSQLTSHMLGRGLIMNEIGLSLSSVFNVGGHDIAFGMTPKFVMATSFDYALSVIVADYDSSLGQKRDNAIDIDVGAAKEFDNGWTTGFAIKNLIGQEYQTQPYVDPKLTGLGFTVNPSIIKIKPQARIGASHTTKWTTVAFDLDLNESESFGFDSKTQYLALGAQLNVFEMTQLRLGYRHNMSDTSTSIATIGIGLDLSGVQLDLAAGASEDEIAYSIQIGFRI